MAYAIFKTGGKQYRVEQGDVLEVERLAVEEGDEINFPEVLCINDGESSQIGAPFIEGAGVKAKVIAQTRGEKGVAFKFKRRKGYHKTKGFRRALTKLEITGFGA